MDSNQNNNNSFNPTQPTPLNPATNPTPSTGFDLSQAIPAASAAPTSLDNLSTTTPAPIPTPTPGMGAAVTPNLSDSSNNGGLSFPSKSPWDSSPSISPSVSTETPLSLNSNPTDLASVMPAQPAPTGGLSLENQGISLSSPVNSTPTPPDPSLLSSPVGLSQTDNSLPSNLTPGGMSSSPSTMSWSPQSMDSTQSVPVNPQATQPMVDSSVSLNNSMPSSGLNLSDQGINTFNMGASSPMGGGLPTSDSTTMPTAPSLPTMDTTSSLPSAMNLPSSEGVNDSSATSSWPSSPTDTTSITPTIPTTDLSSAPSSLLGMESAPTDLSHLVNSSMPASDVPMPSTLTAGPSQFEPTTGSANPVSTISTNQPTASISNESGGSGFPKAIIFLIVGVLLIVAAAVAYFVLGVGKAAPLPVEQHLTNPPAIPTNTPMPTESASSSGVLTITPAPTGSGSASTSASAVDLLRQNK